LSTSNTVTDKECGYGIYAVLNDQPDAGIRCIKPGSESVEFNGQTIALCTEHYDKIMNKNISS